MSRSAQAEELGARLRYRTECTSLEQDADGVTAVIRDLNSGAESSVRAKYVVAADGNRSPIRDLPGIGMHGHGLLSHSITIYFRAQADLGLLLRDRNQGVHYVTNPLMRGFFRLDRSSNAGFLVVNLVGDTSRPEIVAAFPSAPWARVAEGVTEQRALELLRAAIGVPGIPVVIENIATLASRGRLRGPIPGRARVPGRRRRTRGPAERRIRRQHGLGVRRVRVSGVF